MERSSIARIPLASETPETPVPARCVGLSLKTPERVPSETPLGSPRQIFVHCPNTIKTPGSKTHGNQLAGPKGKSLVPPDGRQTVENQIADLTPVADRLGWDVLEVLSDRASGTRGREKRPGYDRLMKAVSRREIDLVAAWSADRIARSLSELVSFLAEIQNRRVDIYLHRQAVDTSTPAGRALFQLLGVFAEFEAALIRERIKAGLARVKAQGRRLGRPPLPEDTRLRIEDELRSGIAVKAIARAAGVAPITVRRIRDARYI
jgi:DNA invertase Pin-like site-specific DNA recombinase